jgi:membrane-bound ClpP family serine protease
MASALDLTSLRLRPLGSILLLAGVFVALSAVACGQERNGEGEPKPSAKTKAGKASNATAQPGSSEDESNLQTAVPAVNLGDGRLIRVRLPLVGNADKHFKSVIQRALAQLAAAPKPDARRPVLILELAPARRHGGYGEGTDFERALSLARYLRSQELASVKTVAYIPQTIKGHGVLVALACEEIVMDPEAELGEAGLDEKSKQAIDPAIVSAYQQIAAARRNVPEAIALGMLDPRLEVLKVETDKGVEFVLRSDLDELEQKHTIVSTETIVPPGSMGSFSGREGREYGFVKLLSGDTESLARGLALPASAVVEDQSLLGEWRPVMLQVEGPITSRRVRQLETEIGASIRDRGANWIGLRIDSPGNKLEECLRLANTIAELDENEVQTVAYVPVEASGGAALVALACDQLVMQPEGNLGGQGAVEFDRETLDAGVVSLRDSLAKNTDHSWSLLAAFVDPELELFSYHNTKTGETRYFSADEAAEQPDAGDWRKGAEVKSPGEPLRLAANRAQELGIATHVVNGSDELNRLYGFDEDPLVVEPNWAHELIEALASPVMTTVLIALGIIGIYIELHAPGIGVGGFVSALSFMLLFWSKMLHGTAGWLEVLLFLGGVCFLLFELLVLPGFGIFGLGGGAMILASLILASQTSFVLPKTESQWAELRSSLTIVAMAAVCVVGAALVLRRYLPQAPIFRSVLLNPTPEEELADLNYRESLADFSHLIGQQGTAATNLMPAGKADFDGQLIDVIADGLPIDRGTAIMVTMARGNRVVVRAVEA